MSETQNLQLIYTVPLCVLTRGPKREMQFISYKQCFISKQKLHSEWFYRYI